jgi:predicted Rossmann-fold nucleotide-binding protein
MEVIVTGGRDYKDYDKVCETLGKLEITLLVQGGATGADWLAKRYAQEHRIACFEVAAEWTKYGKAAGPIRNKEMLLKFPDAVVVAFPGDRGTANCVNEAIKLGRVVIKV